MSQGQFTPAQKVQYWTGKLDEVKQAKALLEYMEKQFKQRLKAAQAAPK
jgi:hypothetical protein